MISIRTTAPGVGSMKVDIVLPEKFRSLRGPLSFCILLEGQNHGTNRGPYGGWHTDSTAARLTRIGKLPPLVLVGVYAPPWRDRVYAPPPWGRSGIFADHLANELIPSIRDRFRLTTDRNRIGIIGASFAANMAIEASLFRPDTFGLCGAFSAAPHAGESLHAIIAKRPRLPCRRLYMDAGTLWAYDDPHSYGGDSTVFNRRAIEIAKSRMPSASFRGRIIKGHYHNEEFWRKRVGGALTFLFNE